MNLKVHVCQSELYPLQQWFQDLNRINRKKYDQNDKRSTELFEF